MLADSLVHITHLAHVAQHAPYHAIVPLLVATGVSALSELFNSFSQGKISAAELAERIRKFNVQEADRKAQEAVVNNQNQQNIDQEKLSGDRTYASGQDDKARTIRDQGALNPDRQELMGMLMQRLGGTNPQGGGAAGGGAAGSGPRGGFTSGYFGAPPQPSIDPKQYLGGYGPGIGV